MRTDKEHKDHIRLDMHSCMPLRWQDESFLPQLIRYKQSGFDAVCVNICFDAVPWEQGVLALANFRNYLKKNADTYLLIEKYSDFEIAKQEGKLGVFFDIEGGKSLSGHIGMIEVYYRLGVRWMLLAYNNANNLGGGCLDQEDKGLTVFGKQVIEKMADLGMMLCCSHVGYKTASEAIEYNPNPSIFSHSNPKGVYDHPRNIPDNLMKQCASKGGVIGINGIGIFLGENLASSDILVQHIDYAVQKIGIEHVGLGLDYVFDQKELSDFVKAHPEVFPNEKFAAGITMASPEQLPEIGELLTKKGYKSYDMGLSFGENWLRVIKKVWK